jgi:hypothetical protein
MVFMAENGVRFQHEWLWVTFHFSLLQVPVVSGREDRLVCLVYRCERVNAVICLLPVVYRYQTRWNEFQRGKRFSTGSVLIEKKKATTHCIETENWA